MRADVAPDQQSGPAAMTADTMISPPSLAKLTISEEAHERPTSPSLEPEPDSARDRLPNGDASTSAAAALPNGNKEPVHANGISPAPSPAPAPAPIPTTAPAPPSLVKSSTSPAVPTTAAPGPSIARSPPIASRQPGIGMMRPPMGGPMGMRMQTGAPMQSRLPPSLQAKMDRIAASRQGAPSPHVTSAGPNPNATSMTALLRAQALGGGTHPGGSSNVAGPNTGPLSLAARRAAAGGPARPNLSQMGMGASAPARAMGMGGRRMGPPGGLTLSGMKGAPSAEDNQFTDFKTIMDPSGSLKFSKAVLHAKGVDFGDGQSFKINMDEMDVIGELGKGNYGSVQKVYHRPTGVMMAMKEMRLELDESRLNSIIMELDILHRAVAPEIVEFFGAFTIESCVYYCMEFMDAGSLDTLTGGGVPAKSVTEEDESAEVRVPEPVLRRITGSIVRGLKFLKDELQIMHRDVKPTNVLMNKKGEIKLCDFGVSGQLEKSLAKTNIGCQSYMAPERIKGESQNQISSYTVSSDVWSVGLSIIELAKGCYPYPPETFANVFAQLQAIVYGPAPMLPRGYSADAHDFVAKCLTKDPNGRPTYAQLLEHPFLLADKDTEVDMVGWVAGALEKRAARGVTPLQHIEA